MWREPCDSNDTFTAEHEPMPGLAPADYETIEGIEVNSAAFNRAPLPVNCMGTSDDEDCHDDPANPCRACFLWDATVGRSRYWDDSEHGVEPDPALTIDQVIDEATAMG